MNIVLPILYNLQMGYKLFLCSLHLAVMCVCHVIITVNAPVVL
jgi:hypothetical protein